MKNIKLRLGSTTRTKLHGIFTMGIPYEIRNTTGDWSQWFGQYEGQKKGYIDTNDCWDYAGCEVNDDSMEFLLGTGRFGKDDSDWFKRVGYIDADGDFYTSRRFIAILSGVTNTGNDEAEFWRLTKKYGAIPDSMLPFTTMEEYFDKSKITQEMLNVGKEFLKRVDIRYEELGKRWSQRTPELIQAALLQTELQIGIPVPWNWNQTKIKWDGGTQPAHSVALYKYDPVADSEYPYFIYDQYEPHLKQLSKDYCIPLMTKAVVNPVVQATKNPVSQLSWGALIWRSIAKWCGLDAVDSQVVSN